MRSAEIDLFVHLPISIGFLFNHIHPPYFIYGCRIYLLSMILVLLSLSPLKYGYRSWYLALTAAHGFIIMLIL